MALSYNEANTVSSQYFDKVIESQVYDESPFFARLKSKNKIVWDGGNQFQWPIRYRELGQTIATTPRAQLAYSQKETRTAAVLDPKYYVGQTMISWDERVKNTGKAQIVNLLKDKSDELIDDFTKKLVTDLYATSQGNDNIQALTTIVDSATSYAGIAVADAAEWASTEDSTTTRVVPYGSTGSLAYVINQTTFQKYKPDIAVTTRNLFNKVESLIEPQKRYEDVEMAKIGFTNIKFHDVAFMGDPFCTAAYMYGLCTDMFELRYSPEYNFSVSAWKPLEQAGFPEAMVKYVTWVGNLICRMRKVNFKYSALDYTL